MRDLDPDQRLKLALHPLAAAIGFRGWVPLRLRRDGELFLVEAGGESLTLPAASRWSFYKQGVGKRIETLAGEYGAGSERAIGPEETVIDIGANIGEFSLYAARHGARVFAIEPDPLVHRCLTANTRRDPRITRLSTLLWSEPAELEFNSAPAHADSSVFAVDAGDAVKTLKVPALPLDHVLAPYRLETVHFLKCDAEGAEPEVLDGAAETLARTRFVAVDTGPERNGQRTSREVETRLVAAGFRVVQREGARPMTFGFRD